MNKVNKLKEHEKHIRVLLKKNKEKEMEALYSRNNTLLIEAFKEYDYLFNELLKVQENIREVI